MVVHRSDSSTSLREWSAVHTLFAVLLCVVLCSGCGNTDTTETGDTTSNVQATTEIPPPPFTIDLAPGYTIVPEVTMVGTNYYFQTDDPLHANDAGGIYFGAFPDTSSPPTEYRKREYRDVFMEDSASWREFTTAKYTHREVFVDKGPDEKIHSWCYAHDSATLDLLYSMIQSIRPIGK